MEPIDNDRCNIFQDPVRSELDILEDRLRDTLHSDIPLIDDICRHINRIPGKRLRPNILFLASRSTGGEKSAALTAGMAVELIHTATLIHDDIIDNHLVRRGQETVFAKWGNNIATIMGDFLYSRAFTSLSEVGLHELMAILARATNIMSVGEMLQFQQAGQIDVDEASYMDMIYGKTASLFSASSECGAVIGTDGNGDGTRESYSGFGKNVGLAFQITDDLFDYIAVDELIGKPVASDFTDGRVTLPFITAFRNAPDLKKKRVSELFHVGVKEESDWGEVVSFVQSYGGVEYSLNKARELGEKAKDSLSSISPSRERDALCYTADYITERVLPFSA